MKRHVNVVGVIGSSSSCFLSPARRSAYDTHFGKLRELSKGETVIFTDMEGIVSTYCVEKLETLSQDAVDTVLNGGYDLVLYTCTKGGRTRVAVFCRRAEEITPATSSKETGLMCS